MNLLPWVCLSWCVWWVVAGVAVRRAGWLDRVVSHYRQRFINDVEQTAPVQLRASLVRAPPAPDEASAWNFEAVQRLLALIAASEGTAPLRRSLQRALRLSGPTRRFYSAKQSWDLFPSLGKKHPNEIYYDFPSDTDSYEEKEKELAQGFDDDDDAVLVLDNPVEARLPAAQISVKLLRDILESRALAARVLPTTVKSTIPWIPMNKTSTDSNKKGDNSANETAADGATPGGDDAGGADNAEGTDKPEEGDNAEGGDKPAEGEQAAGEGGEGGEEGGEGGEGGEGRRGIRASYRKRKTLRKKH